MSLTTTFLKAAGLKLLLLLVIVMAVSGCLPANKRQQPVPVEVLEADVAERTPGSVELDVIAFNWSYINGGAHIKIVGVVKNNSEVPLHSVTLYAEVFNETGNLFGRPQSYVYPSYLPVGGEGKFEFLVMLARDFTVKKIKLVTAAKVAGN